MYVLSALLHGEMLSPYIYNQSQAQINAAKLLE